MLIVTGKTFNEALEKTNLPVSIKSTIKSYFLKEKERTSPTLENSFGVSANAGVDAIFIKRKILGLLNIEIYLDNFQEENKIDLYGFEIQKKEKEQNELYLLFVGNNFNYNLVSLNEAFPNGGDKNYTIYDIYLNFKLISNPLLITVPMYIPVFNLSSK